MVANSMFGGLKAAFRRATPVSNPDTDTLLESEVNADTTTSAEIVAERAPVLDALKVPESSAQPLCPTDEDVLLLQRIESGYKNVQKQMNALIGPGRKVSQTQKEAEHDNASLLKDIQALDRLSDEALAQKRELRAKLEAIEESGDKKKKKTATATTVDGPTAEKCRIEIAALHQKYMDYGLQGYDQRPEILRRNRIIEECKMQYANIERQVEAKRAAGLVFLKERDNIYKRMSGNTSAPLQTETESNPIPSEDTTTSNKSTNTPNNRSERQESLFQKHNQFRQTISSAKGLHNPNPEACSVTLEDDCFGYPVAVLMLGDELTHVMVDGIKLTFDCKLPGDTKRNMCVPFIKENPVTVHGDFETGRVEVWRKKNVRLPPYPSTTTTDDDADSVIEPAEPFLLVN